MAWNLNWNIIINITYDVFIIGQLAKIISSPPSRTVGVTSVLLYKVKFTVISNNICCQVKVDSTFTALTRFVLNNEKVFTVKFITYCFA